MDEIVTFDGKVTDLDVDAGGALYVVGSFTTLETAKESRSIANVAKYDGKTWTALGSAPANAATVRAVGGNVDLGGSTLDVGVQAWDGTTWTSIPFGDKARGQVTAIDVENGELVVGGSFRLDDTAEGGSIARLKGSSWELVGGGLQTPLGPGFSDIGKVQDLLVDGSKIYVTGLFRLAGETEVGNVASSTPPPRDGRRWPGDLGHHRWSGARGFRLGNALTNVGGDVYVSGGFSIAGSHGAVGVARWDGTDWSALDDPKLERIGVNGASVDAIATDKGGPSTWADRSTSPVMTFARRRSRASTTARGASSVKVSTAGSLRSRPTPHRSTRAAPSRTPAPSRFRASRDGTEVPGRRSAPGWTAPCMSSSKARKEASTPEVSSACPARRC